MSRSISDEICILAQRSSIADAVGALAILDPGEAFSAIELLTDWHRSGAETYLCKCVVSGSMGSSRLVVLKACIALTQNLSVEATLLSWIERRKILSNYGIETPKLYGHGGGVILEEFIQLSLTEALAVSPQPSTLTDQTAWVALSIVQLGFSPVSLFADLRSRGTDVVIVDFGADLGPINSAPPESQAIRAEYANYLQSVMYPDQELALKRFDKMALAIK